MATVYVARHGETDWNRAGRYQGRRESSLTELGRQQAEALALAVERAESYGNVRRIISSPLSRCIQTAQPLSEGIGVPIETDERLIEIAHGNWEGRLRTTIERDDRQVYERWKTTPDGVQFVGGESLDDVLQRWRSFAKDLSIQEYKREGAIIIVTHDVLVRLAILEAEGRPTAALWGPHVTNAGFARCALDDGVWTIVNECVDAHLVELRADTTGQAL